MVLSIIKLIKEKSGTMTMPRGWGLMFLGMKISFTEENTAVLQLTDYLEECICNCSLKIEQEIATQAKKNLFDIDVTSTSLEKLLVLQTFHSVLTKLLYIYPSKCVSTSYCPCCSSVPGWQTEHNKTNKN